MVNTRAPDRVKVGRTTDLDRRIAQHNRASNSVGRWTYHDHWEVRDARAAEGAALAALRARRVGTKRELFAVRPSSARRTVRRAIEPWLVSGGRTRRALWAAMARIALAALVLAGAVLLVRRPDLVDALGRGLDWILLR